jgi:hypothetical protein
MGASCGNRHGAVTATASLDVVAVHAWCSAVVVDAHVALLLSVVVDVFEVEGVDVTREEARILLVLPVIYHSRKKRVSYPRSVRQTFIAKSAPQPASMKTPTGGIRIVMIIRRMCEIMFAGRRR